MSVDLDHLALGPFNPDPPVDDDQHGDHDQGGGERPQLEMVGVTKIYPSQPPVTALHAVSLQIAAGELVAIVGPSGSGKTTMLQIIGTLDRPTSGTVRITGRIVADTDVAPPPSETRP